MSHLRITLALLISVSCFYGNAYAETASVIKLDLTANSIGYSQVSGLFYASIPNSASINANSLVPIDPNNGNLGTAIPIGFDPRTVAVSSDGANVFTVVNDKRGVQRYQVSTQTVDQLVTITGGPQISQLLTVPGKPNQFLIHEVLSGFSPPAVTTVVYDNGVVLPDHIGNGLGVGGADIFTIDPTNGTKGYSYVNTNTGFGNGPITLSPTGVTNGGGPSLGGVLTGFNVGKIALIGDHLFTNRGEIFSLSLGVQVGAFQGGNDFVFDPDQHRFFSVASTGTSQIVYAYSLDNFASLGSLTLNGIGGSTSDLTRFGKYGLGFLTSNNEVIFVNSHLVVPETTSLLLTAFGLMAFAILFVRRNWAAK